MFDMLVKSRQYMLDLLMRLYQHLLVSQLVYQHYPKDKKYNYDFVK
jgi:hypothetical protein